MKTLQVRISRPNLGSAQYAYELRSWDESATGPLEQEHTASVNQDLVKGLCEKIDDSLRSASGDGDALWATLARDGQVLFDTLFSHTGQPELVQRLREMDGPLLVHSNEHLIPWELLYDGEKFLGLTYDLGRRATVTRSVIAGRSSSRVRRALVVGDTLGDLESAREETRRISEWLTERGVECTVLTGRSATPARVVGELADYTNPYDLFHYSGHVSGAPEAAGLLVHGRKLINADALRPLARIGAPPVVFINGCASAQATLEPGARALTEAVQTMSACMSFMVMGAKMVVGTRAPVADASALRFAEEFYGQLQDQVPAGAAMRSARAGLAAESDTAWASFVLYGDPEGRITTAVDSRPAPAPYAPEPEEEQRFTPDAAKVMRHARQFGAPHALVTSTDLLMALLENDHVRERGLARVGAARFQLLDEVLRLLDSRTGADDPGPEEQRAGGGRVNGHALPGARVNGSHGPADDDNEYSSVKVSDTISRVLDGAASLVRASGRRAISVDDIAIAFVDAGCGTCAELFERCHIRPAVLLLPNPPSADSAQRSLDLGGFGADAAAVIHTARLLAWARGERISTYLLLKAFAVAGSPALLDALEGQGREGRAALRRLARMPKPKPAEFSSRTLASLRETGDLNPEEPTSAAALLASLLAEEGTSARSLLERYGVDAGAIVRELRGSGADTLLRTPETAGPQATTLVTPPGGTTLPQLPDELFEAVGSEAADAAGDGPGDDLGHGAGDGKSAGKQDGDGQEPGDAPERPEEPAGE
ncbi:CHAT domain-containing protein [Streptomyces sp. NPDC050560]|uniref:CHAT domain-containing protein n=1 Tax=Streptomyces sp. NPDC050560 TaxID=3365630 RepID=UPI0037A06CAC